LADLHHVGATAVLVAIIATGLASVALALRGGSLWTDRLRIGLTAVIGLQVMAGALDLASGARPAEGLHMLYGIAALATLPIAGTFAADAPLTPRAWVLAGTCALLLLLAWRLASTG
jgi:hypothetical protein